MSQKGRYWFCLLEYKKDRIRFGMHEIQVSIIDLVYRIVEMLDIDLVCMKENARHRFGLHESSKVRHRFDLHKSKKR